jgi:dihydroflavonol-4-reductase
LPYWAAWAAGRFDPSVRELLGWIGQRELASADKARRELGWTMRPVEESLLDAAASLIEHGLAPGAVCRRLGRPETRASENSVEGTGRA